MAGFLFDLKSFRENQLNGMSQAKFAKQLGITQERISRMESNPEQISVDLLIQIAQHFGMSLDELIKIPKPEIPTPTVIDSWSAVEYIRKTLFEHIEEYRSSLPSFVEDINELEGMIKKLLRKPKVALIGRSDAGKSHMINTLLGVDKLPAHWTPATSIVVHIKHINDRPAYMEDDNVWVFRSNPNDNEPWDDSKTSDEEYCKEMKLSGGGYDLLNSYGTRAGEHYSENMATSAVVFVDSSILLNCDIVDLPGYGTGDRVEDDSLSFKEKSKADIVVYLSIANGFMRSEDISYIKDAIPSIPQINDEEGKIKPLANLFIVASQAHVIDGGDTEALEDICDKGSARLENSITEGVWYRPHLKERFYYYSSNTQNLRKFFENDFCKLIEQIPAVIEKRARTAISEWIESKSTDVQNTIGTYDHILSDRKSSKELLKKLQENEPSRYQSFRDARQNVLKKIELYKKESVSEVSSFYDKTIRTEYIVDLMERKNIKNKKTELEDFSSYISSKLQNETNHILQNKSEALSEDIKDFLDGFDHTTNLSLKNNISISFSPFNTTRVFAAGLTGVATYGALAFWAASCGNLGGYILVAKGVSLLSALGISVGGTAAAASAVAAIGGPVVLGVALAFIAAVSAFAIFSGNWRKSFAKRLVSKCEDANCLDDLKKNINAYWADTAKAFSVAADNLDKEWNLRLKKLREQILDCDENAIQQQRDEANKMLDLLKAIPY